MRAIPLILILTTILAAGCGDRAIKDDFCGIHINYQYCKCAFHNEFCDNIGMTASEAKAHVYEEYEQWLQGDEYGIIEKEGRLDIKSKPGEVLEITTADLPAWARDQIVTIGATITTAGTVDTITEGDSSVLLNGLPIARVGDATAHGGEIVNGSSTIFVNGKPAAIIGGYAVDPSVGGGGVPNVGGPIVSTGY